MFHFSDTCGHLCIEWMKPCDALIPLFCKWGHRSSLHCNIKRHPRCCVFELLNFPHSQLTQKKKKLPPEAHTRLTVTQLANPSSRKRNILKSFFNHFPHTKKNPEEDQRYKSLHLRLSCAPYACWAAVPAHLLCANLSSALSKDEKKEKTLWNPRRGSFDMIPNWFVECRCEMLNTQSSHPEQS